MYEGAYTVDAEASGLLDDTTVDYNSSPYKLKHSFKTHCIVVEEHLTGDILAFYDGDTIKLDGRTYFGDGKYTSTLEHYQPIEYTHKQLNEFTSWVKSGRVKRVIAHNGINFDLLLFKLVFGLEYQVCPDLWGGFEVTIEDTLVTSKTLNPDRFGGHSLDSLGKKVGLNKIDFRPNIKKDLKFIKFAPDMLYYCIRDVQVNTKVFYYLEEEKGNWDWSDSLWLEKFVKYIVTMSEHRGFKFDSELASRNIEELDELKEEAKQKIEPILPNRVPTKGFLKEVTPPKRQFKKDGKFANDLLKYIQKHNGEIVKVDETGLDARDHILKMFGKEWKLPLSLEPMISQVKCNIDDSTPIKEWLVSLGWNPSEWNERDLTMYSDKKKGKLPEDKFVETVERYVEQTLNSPLKKLRCAYIETSPNNLREKLLSRNRNRPIKVATNPKFTVGQQKELCPNLDRLSEQFPYARDIVDYLTYKHRRNSILGGGLDLEYGEEAEKGFLAHVRSDGRIPTPADTCGAATSRFTHKCVANIPRVTSLYGGPMRSLFGVSEGFIQVGYDFDSLEAKIEADGVYRYPGGVEYGKTLIQPKPNDCHTKLSVKISEILKKKFSRGDAKTTKYAAAYGAMPPRLARTMGCDLKTAQIVYNTYWEEAKPLKLLEQKMIAYWETKGDKKFLLGLDGRKLPVRSKSNLINTRFQSSGVICAKRAMVIHYQKLKKEGLIVDFFKDDWKNKRFAQQLIAYHDEAQLEESRELVKFKVFRTEEEAEEFKNNIESSTGDVWSDVGHYKDKWYVGYSRTGELAIEAVKEAGEYYKLNIPLTAGYMLGNNWATCH